MITPDLIADIEARLGARRGASGLGPEAALAGSYAGLRSTWCSDDDVSGAAPVAEGTGFRIYLVDGSRHCMGLTDDYADAVGVVVAEVADDE